MKKQLRKLLSALLVLAMLLSALPMAAFAEETGIPVVVDVPAAEEETIETPTTEEPEALTTEPTEAPATEEPEASAAEPTEAPAAEKPEATAAEPTEVPAVEEPEATATEPTEATAAEESEATATEPTEVPAVEESEATAAEPTEVPAVEESEATAAEPTEVPAVEESEATAAEPTEVPAVEESEATAAEPTEVPAVEEPEATAAEPTIIEEDTILSDELFIQLLSLYAEGGTDNEETLKQVLSEANGTNQIYIDYFGSADFDGDGVGEAFASIRISCEGIRREFVFVTEEGVQYIDTDDLLSEALSEAEEDSFEIYDLGDECLFAVELNGASADYKYIFAVGTIGEYKAVVDLSSQYNGEMRYEGGNDFTSVVSAFDAFEDIGGHTWKPYYYYYEDKEFKEYGGIYITEEELLEFDGAQEIIDAVTAEGYAINDIIYRGNGIIHINYLNPSNKGNYYVTLSYDATSVTNISEGDGHYSTRSSGVIDGNAVYPGRFIHPSEAPCTHETTHKEEDVSKRKYTYLPLTNKEGYHSVSVTKTFCTICDDCWDVIGNAFTEMEQLDDARHNFVNSICDDCGYENICKHDGERRTETITDENYKKLEDGSGHIHTTTVTEKVYCVACESYIESKVISENSVTEPHNAYGSCELCGYKPYCSHKVIAISTMQQDGVIKNDDNSMSHKIETWEITVRQCVDCRAEISRGSKVIDTKREAHSLERTYHSYGAVDTCSVCNYSRFSTQSEVWSDMSTFLQDSALDEITTWVMNQSDILTVVESLMKLPTVAGKPYEAVKEAVQQGITKDYYTSMMKTILLDILKEEQTKYSDKLKENEWYPTLKAFFESDEWNEEMFPFLLSSDPDDPFSNLAVAAQIYYEIVDKFNDLREEVETAAEIMEGYNEWASLMDNYILNMEFLCRIGASASPDSELYKACLELQSEMLNEMGGFAEFCEITLDKMLSRLTEDAMEALSKELEKKSFPLLGLLSTSGKILKDTPNYYSDLHKRIDAKEDILGLYVLRVDVSAELQNAVTNDSSAAEDIMAVYSMIVDLEFDAVETYLQEQAKQQAGFLGDIGRFFGRGDNYTAADWLKDLHEDQEAFTDVYGNAWVKAEQHADSLE